MKNYYDELNLKKNATASEIKSAFKKMAKEYHPDSNSGGDAEKFKTINEAYQILNDSSKKAEYDIKLNTPNRGRFSFSFDEFFKHRNTNYDAANEYYEDPFIKSHYDVDNAHKEPAAKQKTKGSDLKISLDIYPEDTTIEFSKKIKYNRNIICNSCNSDGYTSTSCGACRGIGLVKMMGNHFLCNNCDGTGKIQYSCDDCSGEGFQKQKKEVHINIPKGITIANTTKMKEYGNQGTNGEYGDLIIYIKDIISSEKFQISNDVKDKYVYTEQVIDFYDAITGVDLKCETLRGTKDVSIQSMQIFKNHKVEIPNSGIPKQFGTQTYTPHVIFFHIQYPELTEDQINYIKKIKEIINEDSGNSEKSGEHGSSEIKNIIDNSTEYTKDKKE